MTPCWRWQRRPGGRSVWTQRRSGRFAAPPIWKSANNSSDPYKAIGRTYFTRDSDSLGLMTMSYFGRVAERCNRASYGFISLAATRTPSGYSPSKCRTIGCDPFQVIRRAHCRTTSRLVSNTPFHFFSNADQQRSIRLYLLWYGG